MKKIGITGGIGSGKSTVCKIFETLEIPVYYSDDRAKWLMQNQPELVSAIKEAFGEEMYDGEGRLQRKKMADAVFGNPEKLALLNSLVHPAVFQDGFQWEMEQAEKNVPYCLKEAALMYESGSHQFLDQVIVVTAPENVRIQRVMARDGVSEAEVKSRIARQMPEEEKIQRADYIIVNDGELMLTGQVLYIHNQLINGL